MKTDRLMLRTYSIWTQGLEVSWYKDGQMMWYTELKDDKWHGDWKYWDSDGELFRHTIYNDGRPVKRIV